LEKKKPKAKMEEVLSDPSKQSYSTVHHLLRIWREFLTAEQVTPSKWTRLVGDHITRLRQIKEMNAQAIGTERGNLVKALIEKPTMSLPALIRGMEFLGSYKSIRISITGIKPDGTEVTNSAVIPLQKRRMFGDINNPPEGSTTSDPSVDEEEDE